MKKIVNIIIAGGFTLILAGCSFTDPEIKFDKPKEQIPKKEEPIIKKNKGSLYTKRGTSLFADKKDLQVGDIIQVVISEALTKDTNNKRELSNARTNSLGGGLVTPMDSSVGQDSRLKTITNKINSVGNVSFGTTSSEDFAGEVKTAVDESFETTVSVIIEETYQNGNYFIKGVKELLIDNQKQDIVISGVIRPYDITPENTITSSQIANLKIMYKKDGEEQDVMHVPWGYKILRLFWPF